MKLDRRLWRLACVGVSLLCYSVATPAREIQGRITTTLTITEDSVLVGDVTCAVENAACIVLGAPNITLDLDGYAITGLANAETACSGGGVGNENGIQANRQAGLTIRGPGVIQQMRGWGINLSNSNGGKITGVTTTTNCYAGIMLVACSGYELENNVSVRNGHLTGA